MHNCHNLAQKMVNRARERQHKPSIGRQSFQFNVVIEELDNGPESEMDVFEVALGGLDLRKEEWLVDSSASYHVSGDQNVFHNLDLRPSTSSITTAGNEILSV